MRVVNTDPFDRLLRDRFPGVLRNIRPPTSLEDAGAMQGRCIYQEGG